MNIKHAVRKVAAGVVAVVGFGVVGLAVAQVAGLENPGSEVLGGSASMSVEYNVELRAVLRTIPNLSDSGTPGLFTGPTGWRGTGAVNANAPTGFADTSGAVVKGNLGHVFVQTNATRWDVRVELQNGGQLVREPKAGDETTVFGGGIDTTCQGSVDIAWSKGGNCKYDTIPGQDGVALQVKDGNTVVKCTLEVAVGIIPYDSINTWQRLRSGNYKGNIGSVWADTIEFTNAGGRKIGSFAKTLSRRTQCPTGASGVDARQSQYFNGTWGSLLADSSIGTKGFPRIVSGIARPDSGLQNWVGNNDGMFPLSGQQAGDDKNDGMVAFYINGRMSGKGMPTGNSNGVYRESLIFTFYGSY